MASSFFYILCLLLLVWLVWTVWSWRRLRSPVALPPHLERFVREALIGTSRVVDVHMHAAGMQPSVTGCCVHRRAWDPCRPHVYLKTWLFCQALGVRDFSCVDRQVVEQLVDQMTFANRYVEYQGALLAFDAVYDTDGRRNDEKTSFEVPNDYVLEICATYPSLFFPCISVHPYRSDAVDLLRHYHSRGVRMVKWLPKSQLIDPENERCFPFYDALRELEMTLLCHVGDEHSITAAGVDQRLGDPRKLRAALDRGVRVIMAHCASKGVCAEHNIPNFNLFVAMMEERRYDGLLFGDVSAMTAFRRAKYLKLLARFPRLHGRIFYGSDYPVPCIPLVPLTIVHWWLGIISWRERRLLNELYRYNTLLFNLVLLSVAMRSTAQRRISFARVPGIRLHASSDC